jgi:hypothetical protein
MPQLLTRALMIATVAALCASCATNKKQDQQAAKGCCQVTATSCASPITQDWCTTLGGTSFKADQTCNLSSGACEVQKK